jgi:hypothetical protein
MILPGFEQYVGNDDDVVYTSRDVARRVIEHFLPDGKILDPCRGNGVFSEFLPKSHWCELRDGRDFFEWWEPVDWIIGNPPYRIFSKFLRHSMFLAKEIIYLIPINKCFSSDCLLKQIWLWGGIREIFYVGDGQGLGWPLHGYCVGAVNFSRGYRGGIRLSGRLGSDASQ